jgi:hypothetical protein
VLVPLVSCNVGNVGGFGNVDTSAKGIAGLAASGLMGGPIGLAANIVGQMIGMPSVSDVVGRAMGIGVFGGGDSTSTGTANATDTGDMGSEAANNAATDAANASVGAGGDSTSTGTANATDTGDMGSEAANNAATAAANAAAAAAGSDGGSSSDGGSTGSDGPFRDGGRVGLYDGGSAFDNYRAPQFMDNRIFYLQGGLASLLG